MTPCGMMFSFLLKLLIARVLDCVARDVHMTKRFLSPRHCPPFVPHPRLITWSLGRKISDRKEFVESNLLREKLFHM